MRCTATLTILGPVSRQRVPAEGPSAAVMIDGVTIGVALVHALRCADNGTHTGHTAEDGEEWYDDTPGATPHVELVSEGELAAARQAFVAAYKSGVVRELPPGDVLYDMLTRAAAARAQEAEAELCDRHDPASICNECK